MLKKAVKKISTVRQVAQITLADEGNVMIRHHWWPLTFAFLTTHLYAEWMERIETENKLKRLVLSLFFF